MKNKYRAVIVSDLHLGTKSTHANQFLEFLDTIETDILILNGDIIDGWALARGSKWRKKHTKVLAKILKMSKTTKVIWIRGNHDEFLVDFIGSKLSNIEIREDYRLETFVHNSDDIFIPKHYYVFHGDVIDIFMTKYGWLSHIGSIGYDIALWLNRWYNRYRKFRGLTYKSISQKLKGSVKKAANYINDFETTAVKMAAQNGCYGVICGHIHEPADRMIDGYHYLNTGDWVENGTAILLDDKGNFSFFTLQTSHFDEGDLL